MLNDGTFPTEAEIEDLDANDLLPDRMHRYGPDGPLGGRPYSGQFRHFLQHGLPYDLRRPLELSVVGVAGEEDPNDPPRRRKPLRARDWPNVPYVYERLRARQELRALEPRYRLTLQLQAVSMAHRERKAYWQVARLFHCSPKDIRRWAERFLEVVKADYIREE